jgi:hypothetical protein
MGHAARMAAVFVALAVAWPGGADARPRRRPSPFALEPPAVEATPAFRYAQLTTETCLQQLDARGVPYERTEPKKNVDTPLRFTGPIRGVTFAPTPRGVPDADARLLPSSIADCRLALAIDDLAVVLKKYGVVRAEYLSMYRPNGFMKPGRRHPSALAIDLATIKLDSGQTYSVRYDFHGRVGAKTCGDKAPKPTKDTPGSKLWRQITCDLADKGSFNLLLTPNHDWGHRDHFHMEVRTGIRWFLIN